MVLVFRFDVCRHGCGVFGRKRFNLLTVNTLPDFYWVTGQFVAIELGWGKRVSLATVKQEAVALLVLGQDSLPLHGKVASLDLVHFWRVLPTTLDDSSPSGLLPIQPAVELHDGSPFGHLVAAGHCRHIAPALLRHQQADRLHRDFLLAELRVLDSNEAFTRARAKVTQVYFRLRALERSNHIAGLEVADVVARLGLRCRLGGRLGWCGLCRSWCGLLGGWCAFSVLGLLSLLPVGLKRSFHLLLGLHFRPIFEAFRGAHRLGIVPELHRHFVSNVVMDSKLFRALEKILVFFPLADWAGFVG